MKIRELLCACVMGLAGFNSLQADDIGIDIPATSFDFESAPNDRNIIRKMSNKVGYIKPDAEDGYSSWAYQGIEFGDGASHLTVRAACGSRGGTLHVRLATFYYNGATDVATIQIPNTGGWNSFRDFTVEVDQEVIANLGGRDLYFVVESNDDPNNTNYLFDVQSFRFDNLNGDVGKEKALTYFESDSGYWYQETFDFGMGASSLTVTAASESGGTLYVLLGNHYNLDLTVAVVNIPSTGGWQSFQEITVPVDPSVIAEYSGRPLFFVMDGYEYSGPQFDVKSFRFNK